MSEKSYISKRTELLISTAAVLMAMFILSIAVAQAGSGIEIDAAARNDAQDRVSSLTLPRVAPVTRSASLAEAAVTASSSVASEASAASVWTIPSPAYRIYITADGIYQLSYTDLSNAGLPVTTLDPRTFRMFYMGQEASIQVTGEDDGKFDPGDLIIFYARSVDAMYFEGLTPINQFTGTNVYWLTYGGPSGLRMAVQDGSGAGNVPGPFQHLEQLEFNLNRTSPTYFSSLPFEPDAEHWYRDWYQTGFGGTPTRPAYNFTVQYAASDPYSATFTTRILSENSVPHQVRYFLNGNLILDDTSASGRGVFQTSAQFPQSYFVEGTNALAVELVSPDDKIYLDWMKFAYSDQYVAEANKLAFSSAVSDTWRYSVTQFTTNNIAVYDVSNLIAPQVVSNTAISGSGPYTVAFGATTTGSASYVALTPAARQSPAGIELVVPLVSAYTPLDLLLPTQGADYIIITHRDFFNEALRLAQHRSPQYRVKVIDVQSIYDQFNGGLMSAQSINDFLAYARATWIQPAPSYVVLMGDGSYDMRRYKGLSSNATYIPPYLALVDPSLGETASDNRFVMLDGNDLIPDMNIGRLPVNTLAEATAMVDKIQAYETNCNCQANSNQWNQNLLFVADDLEGGGGDFYEYSDRIIYGYADPPTNTIPLIPTTYTVTKAYLGLTCDVTDPPGYGGPSPANECRAFITNTLNITGALFVSYVGHSTKSEWAAERLFDLSAINSLAPNACLPIMVPMTCYEGSFHEASRSTRILAESYTRAVGKGAIASFSPTGFGLVSGHDILERGLFLAVFHNDIKTLGAAITFAKQYLEENDPYNSHEDLMDTFLLIGDPGLRIKSQAACDTPTGIALAGLDAQPRGSGVRISWQTNSETEMLGFNVLRAHGAGGQASAADYVAINPALIFAQQSGSNSGASYFYDDAPTEFSHGWSYMLEVVGLDGSRTLHGPVDVVAPPWRLYLPLVRRALP